MLVFLDPRWSVPVRRLILAVLSVVLGLAAALVGVGLTVAPAHADDTTTLLAVATDGQTLNDPAVLTTAAGSGLVVWTEQRTIGATVVKVPQVRRQVGTGPWATVPIALGGLDSVGTPYLVQDAASKRVWLTASAYRNGALDSTLGTYLWWSADDGASFTGPIRVWNSFGIGDAAPYGDEGFWTTTGQGGATIGYVNNTYDRFDGPVSLTDRVGSRGAMALASGGPGVTPVLAFQAGETGIWARANTGTGGDLQLFPTGDGLHVGIAGNSSGVVVAAIRPVGTGKALFSRTVSTFDATVGPERRISPADAIFFEVRAQFNEPEANAVWNVAAGDVYTSHTVGGVTGAWSTANEVLSGSASGVDYVSKPDVSSRWVTGLGNRSSDSAGVVWITRNAPVSEKPTVSAKGASSYSAKKRAIALSLRAGAPATAKATVLISGIAPKVVKKGYSFKVKKPGKLTQKLTLPKKLATQLASNPKARIKVKVTVKNAAGKDAVTIRVVRR